MVWWTELLGCLMASLFAAYLFAWVVMQPVAMDIWERRLVAPFTAVLILSAVWAFLRDSNLHTLTGLASFLHSDTGN